MDEDRIGLVLAKTSELRSKIISCIHETSSNVEIENGGSECEESEATPVTENKENDVEKEAESLLHIKDALESLEAQLSFLQALQRQQWYEKESALSGIQYNQKKLLKELNEYNGKDLEVVHEAMAFASETEDSNDLLLPPYPSPPSQDDFPRRSPENGSTGGLKNPHKLHESKQRQSEPYNSVKVLIGRVAKTAIALAGAITILSFAGFEPRLRKQGNQLKFLDLFHQRRNGEKSSSVECPTGKVAVVENGERRCVVKERVEVPFESAVGIPDVSYGCG